MSSLKPCVCLLAVALFGCASRQPAPVASTVKEPPQNTWTPQSPQEPWWEAGEAACPSGATLVGAPPPRDHAVECVLPNGKLHGRASVWFDNGHEGTVAEYRRGLLHGAFKHWLHGRWLVEGQYAEGRRHGKWLYWFDESSDFDVRARWQAEQPLVVEQYNRGLLLNTERRGTKNPDHPR
jgi:hypothetical protein